MADRRNLQLELETILGSRQVYYNPPESIRMTYPAIVYMKDGIDHDYADDGKYLNHISYSVTLISRTPDNPIFTELLKLPLTKYNRTYVSDNLYHDVMTIYY